MLDQVRIEPRGASSNFAYQELSGSRFNADFALVCGCGSSFLTPARSWIELTNINSI